MASYQPRRNELARAMGYSSYYEQRHAKPSEVARRRAGLAKRSGGSYRGKSGGALKPPKSNTRRTTTKGQTTTDTRSKRDFMRALKDAARKNQKVKLRTDFARAIAYTSGEKPGPPRPMDLLLYEGGGRPARALLADIGTDDPWEALERLTVRDNPQCRYAKDVQQVHLDAYTDRPADVSRPASSEEIDAVYEQAGNIDIRTGKNDQYEWLEAEGYIDKTAGDELTINDVQRIQRHQARATRGRIFGGELF